MKKAKKLFAIALVLALALAMSVTAFAQEVDVATGSGSITISSPTKNETYKIYKVFDASVTGTPDGSIAYTGEIPAALSTYFSKDAVGNITATAAAWNGSEMSDGLREALKTWAGSATEISSADSDGSDLLFKNVPYGYYYITSTMGSVITVDSTNPSVTVNDKNVKPTIEKTVEEDSNSTYQKQNDGEYGQTVNFKTVVHAQKGGSGYILYDKMAAGLSLTTGSFNVYKGSIDPSNVVPSGADTWTVVESGDYYKGAADGTATTETGAASFVLTFADVYTEALTTATDLIVTYTAMITDAATVNTAVSNYTTLKYGAANYTAENETRTYVWGAQVFKYTGTDTPLANAKFVIYKKDGTSVYYAKVTDGKLTGWTAADATAEADLPGKDEAHFTALGASVLTTSASGYINVSGLDEGEYYLLEVTAPDGYNKLTAATPLTITSTVTTDGADLTTPLASGTAGVTKVSVLNNAGTELPSTGGIGTTIFYVVGSILVLGAVVLIITRRRMSAEK